MTEQNRLAKLTDERRRLTVCHADECSLCDVRGGRLTRVTGSFSAVKLLFGVELLRLEKRTRWGISMALGESRGTSIQTKEPSIQPDSGSGASL